MRTVFVVCQIFLAMLVAGVASGGDTRPVTAATARKSPALSDTQLETAIRARLASSKINVNHFQVHVKGGIATIEGNTDVIQHKGVATRLAKSSGAVAVNNLVRISEAAKQKAAANLAKGRRRAQLKREEPRSTPAEPRQVR
jgi:hypothetical protein